ncbi:hypothetical protein [Streptomyces sp. NBC_00342]|uniref:hypothetical protein n=1 Tax=Streptomyces sp. NBC_00342 TaxID=2975718 RepID=UPI002E2BC724|nr:hypothetical protein [Streptomyces sp. NBC_00342]
MSATAAATTTSSCRRTRAGGPLRAPGERPGLDARQVPDVAVALRVSTAAARSRSTTAPAVPTGTRAPAEPAMPAHRQQTASAPRQGRGR